MLKLPKIDVAKLGKRLIAAMPSPQMVVIVGATIMTVVVLFVLQEWYRSYTALEALALERDTPLGAEYPVVASEQRRRLEAGPVTIDDGKTAMGSRDRNSLELVRPVPSSDPAPAAGWAHQRTRADLDGDGVTDVSYVTPPIPGQP